MNTINFNKIEDHTGILPFIDNWVKSLTAPQDDMWFAFMRYADQWQITSGNCVIGYACVNEENQLIQFFLEPKWINSGTLIFKDFVNSQKINACIVGSNNPIFLSIALHFHESIKIHTFLFTDYYQTSIEDREGNIELVNENQLVSIVQFAHESTGGPAEWLNGYFANLISRGELYVYSIDKEIVGTFEVRKSDYDNEIANIGMIVHPSQRKKGVGSFLLGKAKEKAISLNKKPICSCEKDNTGSLKSIQKNGFIKVHQLLLINFEN